MISGTDAPPRRFPKAIIDSRLLRPKYVENSLLRPSLRSIFGARAVIRAATERKDA